MKKNVIICLSVLLGSLAYGQVGIDTDQPKATLDIKASPASTTKIDGLIAPRLKGSELQTNNAKYTADQDAAIVYVTEALTTTDDKTLNVTSIGYYYFDKTVGTNGRWMKIANGDSSSGITPKNLTATDGSISVANGTGATLVNTSVSVADGGISTAKIANNAVTIAKLPTGATSTTYLRGDGTWVTPTNTIVTANNGLTKTSENIQLGGALVKATEISAITATNKLTFTATGVDAINFDSNTLSIDATNNRVGILTASPVTPLHVNGAATVGARATGSTIGANSLSVGTGHTVSGNRSLAVGFTNTVSGVNSAAIGSTSTVSGDGSMSFGGNNNLTAANTFAIGNYLTLGGSGIALGNYNVFTSASDNAQLQVGIGLTGPGNSANALTVLTNGRVILGKHNSLPSWTANTVGLAVMGSVQNISTTYADYVFEDYYKGYSIINPSYKFVNLYEAENFIKQNHHLPGVTSIKDLEKTENGYSFNLTELSTQTLEKVEELYLHTIEQQKQIDAQQKQVEELKEFVRKQQEQINQLLAK